MPQERYRKLLPNAPWDLSFKLGGLPCSPSGLVSSLVYEILWGIWIPTHAIAMRVFILVAVISSLPPAVLPCGSILFPFVLSVVAPGDVHFCTPCNIPSLHPPGVPFLPLQPHLFLPSILGTPFPSYCIYASCVSRTLYRLNRSLPSIVSGTCIRLRTRALVGHSVPMARFVSGRSPAHLVAWQLSLSRGRVVVVYLTVNLETFPVPLQICCPCC